MSQMLPALIHKTDSDARFESEAEVWIRINAFLSLKSENTRRTYAGIIREWCLFLGAQAGTPLAAEKIIQARDLHAAAYKAALEQKAGQAPRFRSTLQVDERALAAQVRKEKKRDGLQHTLAGATIAKKFAALRRIYRMLIHARLGVNENPFDTDRVPPPSARSGQKRPTEMVDFDKVLEIIDQPDAATAKGQRDRAILALLFGGGLRRSEAVSLRIADLRTSANGTAYVRLRATKAKTDADQALPGWAAEELRNLVSLRKQEGAAEGDYLFISYRGRGGLSPTNEPLTDSGLYKLFKSYCRKAGVEVPVSPHSARATAITKLLADGVSHREVQEFSRHSSVQMVEAYDKRRFGVDKSPAQNLNYKKR